jgi:hypothetical protein
MNKVICRGKHLLIEVRHNGITYDCVVSYDCKNLYECEPKPDIWVEIENIIRDAAWRGEIEDLDKLG